MRKAIFLLAALMVVASYTACESDDPATETKPTPEPTEASIEISETEITLDDNNTYTLTFKSSHDWTISSSDGWCSVSPASGKAGEASVVVSGQANESAADRNTILTIKADKAQATVRVLQLKKELPPEPTEASIEISETEITLDDNNTYTLTFKSSHDWTISASDGWCSLSPVEGKAGEASVVVSGQTNESAAERSTILTIKADKAQATVQVLQLKKELPAEPTIEAGVRGILLKSNGDSYTLRFTASHDWTVSTDDDWCSVSPIEGKAGEVSVKVKGTPNESTLTRFTKLTIRAEDASLTLDVEQPNGKAPEASIKVEIKAIAIGGINEPYTLRFTSSHDWTASASDDWCSVSPASGKAGDNHILIKGVTSVSSNQERRTTVTIDAHDTQVRITVLQVN